MITVVTSCSAKGYEEYGKKFLETFRQWWPPDVNLWVVSEDELPPMECKLRLQLSEPASDFMARHEKNMVAHGRQHVPGQSGWSPRKIAEGYNFRYDAFRFAKKVFAIDLVNRKMARAGRLFWVDADVVSFAPVRRQFLERMLPADMALSCLDRGHYHSECGFVGYNLDHPLTATFISNFAGLYASDRVFNLAEWHDSWVFDWLRREMVMPTYAIPHRSRSHPFCNSDLGRCMDHRKGSRKKYGKTPFEQLAINKDVRYYRGVA